MEQHLQNNDTDRKKLSTWNALAGENTFKNKDEKRSFKIYNSLKKIYQQHTTKNLKGSPSSRRKMLWDVNLDPHKGMKSTRNGNYMGKYKDSDNWNGLPRWH